MKKNNTTTVQSLGSLIKSARDIMRKDKGLNGDLDRLPLLTWIMFLKFLDDLEMQREEEAQLAGKKFNPALEAPYRWRAVAAVYDRRSNESDEVRRSQTAATKFARAAVVVPNGTLFGDGVCARIKEELLK